MRFSHIAQMRDSQNQLPNTRSHFKPTEYTSESDLRLLRGRGGVPARLHLDKCHVTTTMNEVPMNGPFPHLGQQQNAAWGNLFGVTDPSVLPYNTLPGLQDLGHARRSEPPSRPENGLDFLHSIYLLRKSSRQSNNPSTAEMLRLEQETGLPEYQISSWFDGERKQRDFWISQNSLPTPRTTQTFTFGSIDQCLTSSTGSNSLVSHFPITSSPTTCALPGSPIHMNIEPGLLEASLGLYPHRKHRGLDTLQKSCSIDQAPQRKKRQLRRQKSDDHDNADENEAFHCPTCMVSWKTRADWHSHQERRHFPRIVWVCGGTEGKLCKVRPCYRRDNFRNHLVKSHGLSARSDELEAEVKKRAVRVTGLFHEKCGFCKQDLDSWDTSMRHIWDHIESGKDMSEWTHVCQSKEHELQVGVHYPQPPGNSQPDGDGFDKDDHNDDDPNSSGGGHGDNSHFGSFGGFDNFDFGSGFEGGFNDGSSGQGHCYDTQAPQNYQYHMSFSNSQIQDTTRSLSQAQAAERARAPKHFSFVRTLGSGGFGRVDEVTCNELQQRFALKILRRRVPGTNASLEAAAFKKEVEVLKTLVHPHIIRFVGSRMFGNAFSILMHPVVEGNLATYIHQSDLELHQSLLEKSKSNNLFDPLWTFMGCLASAVSYIHSVNIIHGDLKPENVLIDGTQIILTDFGSAKKLSNDTQASEDTCTLSPEFSAPEAIRSGHKDSPGDIWSFGCILTLVATRSVGRNLDDFDRFRLSSGVATSFHSSLQKTLEWLAMLEAQVQVSQTSEFGGRTLFKMILRMISEEPNARPRAQEVWNLLPKDRNCKCNSQSSRVSTRPSFDASEARVVDQETTSTTSSALMSSSFSTKVDENEPITTEIAFRSQLPATNNMPSISIVPDSNTANLDSGKEVGPSDSVVDRTRNVSKFTKPNESSTTKITQWKRFGKDIEDKFDNEGDETELSSKNKVHLSLDEVPRFACPFRKHDPSQYNVYSHHLCALTGFADIARLKEHLYRKHRTYNCARCSISFRNQAELDAHTDTARPEACVIRPPTADKMPGISLQQEAHLRSKKKAVGETGEDRWRSIYKILFPSEEVPSPYFEQVSEEHLFTGQDTRELKHFEGYLRRELPRVVSSSLEEAIVIGGDPAEDLLRQRLSNLIVECQDKIFQQYRWTSGAEEPETSKNNNDVDGEENSASVVKPRFSSLRETSPARHDESSEVTGPPKVQFGAFKFPWTKKLDQSDADSPAFGPFPNPRGTFAESIFSVDSAYAPSDHTSFYDDDRKLQKQSNLLLGSRYSTSALSVRSGDSGYASNRTSLAPSSIHSPARGYLRSQQSIPDLQNPHPQSLYEFKGLYRVPCPVLHEPPPANQFYMPTSFERFKDVPTCQYCRYSGVHNLSWSAQYLNQNVFMAELKLVGVYDAHAIDAVGNSALHYAAAGGANFQHFTALINAGASPDQLNTAGQLFLHCLQPQLKRFGSDSYDDNLVSLFKADLVNLINIFHSQGGFRWRDNEGRTPMDSLSLHIKNTEVKEGIFRMVKNAGYSLDISKKFDAASKNVKVTDHRLLTSRNTHLPTKDQCSALTDEQCRRIQEILDPDDMRFQKSWELKYQPELIRLYMTGMSFPQIESAMTPRLRWSYKTYSNRFRDWFFPLNPSGRDNKIIELYALVSDSPLDLTAAAPPLQSKSMQSARSIFSATRPNDFVSNQERQQKAFQILERSATDPSYVDPETGDNIFHALSRIQLNSATALLSKIQDAASKGAELNLHNRDRYNPLAAFIVDRPFQEHAESGAILSKYLDMLLWKDSQRRIPNKINVNMRNREGATALYYAAIRGLPDSVRSLIEAGANVNARLDVDGHKIHKISILQATMNAKTKAVMQNDTVQVCQFDTVIAYLQHDNAMENPSAVEERRVFEAMVRIMPV